MSKIICEVCGTSYPGSAAQCPICGCVKPQGKQPVAGDTQSNGNIEDDKAKKPVRGGRYSKSNVRKRNKTNQVVPVPEKPARKPRNDKEKNPEQKSGSSKGLTILAIILLLAIIAMLVYIALRFFVPLGNHQDQAQGSTAGDTYFAGAVTDDGDDTNASDDTTTPSLVCTDLVVSESVVELTSEGQACLLNVTPVPSDTTDEITYVSSDESVVTVSSKGKVIAIAPGQAEITVTCGDVEKTVRIIVSYEEDTSAPEDTTAETTVPEVDDSQILELNREDITMSRLNEEWQLYTGSIAKPLITFSSADPSVATFEGGKVVAVGPGMTTVYAEYGDQKVSCIIRCNFTVSGQSGFNTGVGEG